MDDTTTSILEFTRLPSIFDEDFNVQIHAAELLMISSFDSTTSLILFDNDDKISPASKTSSKS